MNNYTKIQIYYIFFYIKIQVLLEKYGYAKKVSCGSGLGSLYIRCYAANYEKENEMCFRAINKRQLTGSHNRSDCGCIVIVFVQSVIKTLFIFAIIRYNRYESDFD